MRNTRLTLISVIATAALAAALFAQTTRTTTPPHAPNPNQDARFGTAYSLNAPAPLAAEFADKAAWEKRAEFLSHQVAVANGLWPMPPKTPLNAVIHGKIDKDEFTIEKVYFTSLPGHYVTGNLYRPKNVTGKVPAVLTPYGHWPLGRFWWRNDADIKKEIDSGAEVSVQGARSPLQATAANLARLGCVVFEWDLVGFGDSMVIKHQEGFTDAQAVLRLQSFMGLQTWNGIRALDFVASLPEVDPTRIAVSGSSGGATQTMQLGAVEPRVAATFPIVMVGMHMQGGCVCENAPLLRVGTNNVEIAALLAPKPQCDCGASGDNTRDFETNGYPQVKRIYELLDAKDNVSAVTIPFGHNHNVHSRELLYNFLNRTFKLGITEGIKEQPIEPVPVAQLSVWDAQHLKPADFADAKTVRGWMTKTSDEQLAALERDPAGYRETLKVALQAMVVDALPEASDVASTIEPSWTEKNGAWRGWLGRKSSGERIPCAYIRPEKWNGTVVIWTDLAGIKNILSEAGEPTSQAKKVLETGAMVLAIESFMSDSFKRSTPQRAADGIRMNYSAYANGYERTILGERVHDLLSVIALSRGFGGAKSIRVVGTGEAGVAGLLATALAGDSVDRAAIDLAGFDFDKVADDKHPNFLPGAVKYGGVYGFAPLSGGKNRQTLISAARESGKFALAAKAEGITIDKGQRAVDELIQWIVK